jgi:hypothetical protein
MSTLRRVFHRLVSYIQKGSIETAVHAIAWFGNNVTERGTISRILLDKIIDDLFLKDDKHESGEISQTILVADQAIRLILGFPANQDLTIDEVRIYMNRNDRFERLLALGRDIVTLVKYGFMKDPALRNAEGRALIENLAYVETLLLYLLHENNIRLKTMIRNALPGYLYFVMDTAQEIRDNKAVWRESTAVQSAGSPQGGARRGPKRARTRRCRPRQRGRPRASCGRRR